MTSRRFVFTVNNYTSDDELGILELEKSPKVKYCCYGREIGESGTPHLQGYLEVASPCRISGISKIIPRAWIGVAHGSAIENQKYTGKDLDWISFGTPMPGQGFRSDLKTAMRMVEEKTPKIEIMREIPTTYARYPKFVQEYQNLLEKEETRDFRVIETHVLWGEAGTGKTKTAHNSCAGLFTVNPEDSFPFDGYDGEEGILIDDFQGQGISHQFLLRILDRYQLRVNVKGGHRYARWTKVWITSNKPPMAWYPGGLSPALERRLSDVTEFRHEVAGNNVLPLDELLG